MKRWWLVIALLLSLGVNLGILLTLALERGGDPPPGPPQRPPWGEGPWERDRPGGEPSFLERFADRLDLTGEPRERFLDLQRQLFRATVEARTRRARLERELRRELTAPEPDRRRAEELTEELARAHLALEQALARTVLDTRELLDGEQEREYLRLLARLHGRRDRPGPQGGEPRPPWRRPPPGS